MSEIPEEIRKMFPNDPIQLMDIDDDGNLQILASAEPLEPRVGPDFDNIPKEQIDQYLRKHGYDPEQVGIRGKILADALIENVALNARIAELESVIKGMFPMWIASMAYCEHGKKDDLLRMRNYYNGRDNPLTEKEIHLMFSLIGEVKDE